MSIILWFKRDLRIKDHPACVYALQRAQERSLPLIPLYIVEPTQWQQPEHSGRHWAFVRESLEELSWDLENIGSRLIIRTGDAVDVFNTLHSDHAIQEIVSHEEVGPNWSYKRDKNIAAWCRAHQVQWRQFPHSPVTRGNPETKDILPGRARFLNTPTVSAPTALPPCPEMHSEPLPTPIQLGLEDDCPGRQAGGRRAGVKALSAFLLEHGDKYRMSLSSPSLSWKNSSRVSAHLTYGTLSTRELYRGITGRAAQNPSQRWIDSFQAFQARLYNRDGFMQQFEDNIWMEHTPVIPDFEDFKAGKTPVDAFERWSTGTTGFPFFDACMRSLHQTGWINFRMRAMMVSFGSYHLWLPWRDIGVHMARLFTDYEPAIHWPVIQMQSGANLYNLPRIYNIAKQAQEHDPDGTFTKTWCPELRDVPLAHLHSPWEWSGASATLGSAYPKPMAGTLERGNQGKDFAFTIHNALHPERRAKPKEPKTPAQLTLGL